MIVWRPGKIARAKLPTWALIVYASFVGLALVWYVVEMIWDWPL